MKYKKIFISFFLIICILSISSVQATSLDNQTSLFNDISKNVNSVDGTGNYTELEGLITNAAVSDTIILTKDYRPTTTEVSNTYKNGIIIINKDLIIDGANHTIYGDTNRIFQITSGPLTLKNINFVGGDATLTDDNHQGFGSVVLINSGTLNSVNLIVDNANFTGIGGKDGTIIDSIIGSSMSTTSTRVTISNSTFNDCFRTQNLVNFYNAGTLSINSCNFLNNYYITNLFSGSMGTSITVYKSLFLNNSVGRLFSGFESSVRYNYNIILTNTSNLATIGRYGDISLNLDYNYWGTNDNNKINSLFTFDPNAYIYGKTSNFDNIYLNFEGNQSFNEDEVGEYTIYFTGNNAENLPGFETLININPLIGTFTQSTVIVSSTPTTIKLNPSYYGNAVITVSRDGYKLMEYSIIINGTLRDYKLVINSSNIKHGKNLTVDVSLTDENNIGVNGVVNLIINGDSFNVTVNNGRGSININTNGMIPDNYQINATYISTDSIYRNVSNYTTVTINKLDTIIELKSLYSTIRDGDSNSLYALLKDENGNVLSNKSVSIYSNGHATIAGTTNNSGQVSFSFSPSAGLYNYSAVYDGSELYNKTVSNNVILLVKPKINTILTLSSNITGFIRPNQSALFTVKLTDENNTPLDKRNITLMDNGYTIAELITNELGEASYIYYFETEGNHRIIATYSGNDEYYNSFSNEIGLSILTGTTFTDLATLIELAEEGSTILLSDDFTFNSTLDFLHIYGININKNIIIDGNGHTISGSNMSGFFNINGVNVTLRNINFIDAFTSLNAAITVNNGILTMINSTMDNIVSIEPINQEIKTFTINQIAEMAKYVENHFSSFNNLPSIVPYEGKSYSLSLVSYLMAQAILNIHEGNGNDVDTRSVSNPENPSGLFDSSISFTEGQYTNENQASGSNPRTGFLARFVNWIVSNNVPPNYVSYTYNGVTRNIYYTSIVESSARILSYYSTYNELPETTYYIGNIPVKTFSYNSGVAICGYQSNLTYSDSNFKNIVGTNINGALYSDESYTIVNNCNFENNAVNSAGGIYARLGSMDVINSTFINNSGIGEGFGGVFNSQLATINIGNSKFYNNTAIGSYGWGGVALLNGGKTTINNSLFINNKALGADDTSQGGAIMGQNDLTLIINNSTFLRNAANSSIFYIGISYYNAGYGGAISLNNIISAFNVTNSTFKNNYADSTNIGGGAIYTNNANGYIIDGCTFDNNSAHSGGAICLGYDGTSTIINSNFTNNIASGYGGALECGDAEIINSNFINNTANMGGAIYAGVNYLNIYNSTFISNNANNGGVIRIGSDVNARYNKFINNTAVNGGILYASTPGLNFVFNFNIFVNNNVTGNGDFAYYSYSRGSGIYNLEHNYWGFNYNPINDKFIYDPNAIVSINNYINLTIVGTNSTYTTLPTEFRVFFEGENAELLPDFKTTIVSIPRVGEFTPEFISITSEGTVVSLCSLIANNTTIVVGYEYNNLTTLNLEILQLIRNNYTFNIDIKNITYGQIVVLNFNLFDADGVGLNETITYVLNGQEYVITLVNGVAIREFSLYPVGVYEISSKFITTDFFYNNATANSSFEVRAARTLIDINVDDIIFGEYANITAIISNLATGNITFIVNGISQTVTVVNGQANLIIPNLNAGNYTVDVYYNGDGNFETVHANSSFNVNKIDTELTLNIGDAVYGNNILGNLTLATVNGDRITGTVTIIVNGRNYIVNVVNGEGNFTFEPIATGQYTVTATYDGSENYNNVTASTVLDVAKSDSDISFDLEDSYLANENIVLSVLLHSDATGQVIFTINGNSHTANVENGIATVTITGLSYGNYELTANYSGDNNYNPEILSTTINVRIMESRFDISVEDIIYGESLIIVADLDVEATGTVLFTINNRTVESNIVNGKATAIFNGLNAGDYDLTAEYSGDDVYVGLSKTTSVIVNKAPTNIEIVVGDVLDGQPVTIIAIVAPNATGNVTFSITGLYTERNRNINNGNASWLISPLDRGAYTIIAQYDGDNNYLGSNTTYLLSVNQVGTTLNVSVEDSEYGEDVIVNIRLTAEDNSLITAWVYVTVDDTLYRIAVYNGTGRQSIGILEVGSHEFNATYSDYSAMRPSYDEGSFTISRAQSNISVELGANNYTIEDTIVLNISAPSDATGQVTVVIGNITTVLDLNNGYAIYNFRTSTPGEYSISISYSGNNHYNPSQRVFNFSVSDSIKINIEAPDITMYYRDGTRFVVTVTEDNIPVANRDILITINGVNYTRTTDSQGVASMAINLNSGLYEVIVSYGGVRVTSTINVVHTISGNDITKIFRNGTQYYAAFVDSQGNPLANTNVTFNINGVIYYRQTNNDGVARLNINLNPGEYIITAINPVNNEYHSNIITVLPSLIEANDLVMYFQNGSRYTVRVLGDDGNPLVGATVSFNINGVLYHRVSDSNGIAGLNINLNPGEYTITAEYNGLRASNNIKVLPTITAENLEMNFRDGSTYNIKIVDGHGSLIVGKNVTININGVFYNRLTDENGIARLNINLLPGVYIATAYYGTSAISNIVTVLDRPVENSSSYSVASSYIRIPADFNERY